MFIVEFLDDNNYNPCGSDFTRTYKDLKTIRTLLNLKFRGIRKDIKSYNIYQVSNVYNRDSYKLIKNVML